MINMADKNGNGFINKREFLTLMKDLKLIDPNLLKKKKVKKRKLEKKSSLASSFGTFKDNEEKDQSDDENDWLASSESSDEDKLSSEDENDDLETN